MKIKLYLLFLIVNSTLIAQTAFHNFGNVQLHDEAQVGFHLNLTNDGSFDQNVGLVGFYNEKQLTISGAFATKFYDLE